MMLQVRVAQLEACCFINQASMDCINLVMSDHPLVIASGFRTTYLGTVYYDNKTETFVVFVCVTKLYLSCRTSDLQFSLFL